RGDAAVIARRRRAKGNAAGRTFARVRARRDGRGRGDRRLLGVQDRHRETAGVLAEGIGRRAEDGGGAQREGVRRGDRRRAHLVDESGHRAAGDGGGNGDGRGALARIRAHRRIPRTDSDVGSAVHRQEGGRSRHAAAGVGEEGAILVAVLSNGGG